MILWLWLAAWQVSILVGAALLLVTGFRRRSAATRHWILVLGLAAAAAVGPLTLVSPRWLPAWTLVSPEPHQPAGPVAGRERAIVRSPPPATDGAAVAVVGLRAPSRTRSTLEPMALVVWGLGCAAGIAMLLAGLARLRWHAVRSQAVTDGRWRRIADRVRRQYSVTRPVRLLRSNRSQSRFLVTWGTVRPTVLLPAGAERWTDDRIHAVLAHELAHIARRDWLVQLLAVLLRSVFWFNPLVWIAARRLRAESELACDDRVLGLGLDGAAYAAHLVDLARSLRVDRRPWRLAPGMAHATELEGRIHAMLNAEIDRRPTSRFARLVSLAVFLALTVAGALAGAQGPFHPLRGTVRDASNRVLPATRVVLSHPEGRARYEVVSDAGGDFEFVALPAATYALEARAVGFTPFTDRVPVFGSTVRDLQLQVGTLQETITVRGRPATASEARPSSPDAAARDAARQQFDALASRAQAACDAGRRHSNIGGNIMPPRKLLDVRPFYPEHLRASGVGGVVTMTATIGTDGVVGDIQDLKGPHPDLEASAAEAVRQWQFSATWLNCEAIDVEMRVTTRFDPTVVDRP